MAREKNKRRGKKKKDEKRTLMSHVLVTNRVDVCTLDHDRTSSCFKDSTSESHAVMELTIFVLGSASSYATYYSRFSVCQPKHVLPPLPDTIPAVLSTLEQQCPYKHDCFLVCGETSSRHCHLQWHLPVSG